MPEDQKRKDRIVRHIEHLTKNKLGQQCVQQLMRKVAYRMERENEKKEKFEKNEDFEEEEEEESLVDKGWDIIAGREKNWAMTNVWPDYLKNVGVPLKRRARTAICLSFRVPKSMQQELLSVASFNKKSGRIENIQFEDLIWSGKYNKHLHHNIMDIRKRNNDGSRSNSHPRRRPLSSGSRSGSSRHSRPSTASGSSSVKSILKKSKKSSVARKRRSLPKKSKSPAKRSDVRPMGQVSMIKNPVIRHQVRGFVADYSNDPDFEAFSLMVDGIPFVALSLMNAEPSLRERFKNASPPTPVKKHAPGANSPRKSPLPRHHHESRSSSANSKRIRFTDEGCSPKKAEKSPSAEDEKEFRELGETVSDAMLETDRQYNDLWNDRKNSVKRQ